MGANLASSGYGTRLSVTELSQRILEMATTGVYRESLFETFKPVATKRQIRDAIAMAKQFGLGSDPTMRDEQLGTYYQADFQQYESFQTAVAASVTFTAGEDMATRITETTRVMLSMVRVAAGVGLLLMLLGGICVLMGRLQTGVIFWSSALCAGGIWSLQRLLVKQILPMNAKTDG